MASLTSVSGLSTGIDTKTLLEQLIYADRAPARLMETSKATAQTRLDAVKNMNTRLLALRDAIDDTKLGSQFDARSVTTSNADALTATVQDKALAGSTTLSITALASAHQVASQRETTATTAYYSSGSISIRAAGAASATSIAVSDYSLNGIATAINGANAGVTASVINDGMGYRLLVTSTKTGADNGIAELSADGDLAGLLPGVGGMTEAAPARNATVVIGDPLTGLQVESASNTIDQVVPGVTLTAKALASNITITVEQSSESIRGNVQAMADAFNAAQGFWNSNSRFDVNTKRSGALFNDYDLGQQLNTVESKLAQSFASQPSGYKRLADIGVSIASDGTMKIDAEVFDAKVAENSAAVEDLLQAAGNAATPALEGLTRSVDGTMALKQTTLEGMISTYADRIVAYDARLEQRRALYQAQFTEMEKLTAQFQSQGNALSSFVAGLTKSSSK
ncbi:MAG: flagellar filament capping protein FliD [Planctomycetes bacterium]|nr:flagellar filament capping protein FliD [Planctomycetota bacterium]